MKLTEGQVRQFREQGFLAVPGFFGKREVQALQADLERLKAEGRLRNVATEGDGKTTSSKQKNLQICPATPFSTLIRALPFDGKVVAAVSALIGEPMILHLDQIFLKPGGDGMGTNWHQDNAYFQIADPMKGTAMWIAIHDATVANGCMHMIPQSFATKLEHTRDGMSDHHIRCFPDESKEVPVELAAGGVVFFCYGTPHSTKANKTNKERAGLAFHFLREDFAQAELISEPRNYRPYLTGKKATGGEAEYGVKVAGTFADEVEKAIRGAEVGVAG